MNKPNRLRDSATELAQAARAFHAAADQPGSAAAAPGALASLEEALQVLSAAWYQLAANASPGIVEQGDGRGWEVPEHDVAAAFARCARVCREGRSTISAIGVRRERLSERVA